MPQSDVKSPSAHADKPKRPLRSRKDQVQLETETPVFSAVLTPHHFHETDTHRQFFRDHFRIKGEEVARACCQMMDLMEIQARRRSAGAVT